VVQAAIGREYFRGGTLSDGGKKSFKGDRPLISPCLERREKGGEPKKKQREEESFLRKKGKFTKKGLT